MSELYQTTFIRQRNVEQLFAGVAIVNPIATIQDCGWLKPDVINHTGIKKLWSLMLERISPTMDHQEAVEIATQASIEAGIYVETIDWILMVRPRRPAATRAARRISARGSARDNPRR